MSKAITAATWRFDTPWNWHPLDGEPPPGTQPTWPLALLSRHGAEPTREQTAAVALGSASGGHAEELERWCELTGARPAKYEG
ncbi:hypothetical protein ACFYVL_17880 [Streptomyces sp. NPDC004111]|uniref:hypothetical protein n=1 Tax=Streptomyces sp. NPDC004111 TaxID=3364690 RepID=UPI003687894D